MNSTDLMIRSNGSNMNRKTMSELKKILVDLYVYLMKNMANKRYTDIEYFIKKVIPPRMSLDILDIYANGEESVFFRPADDDNFSYTVSIILEYVCGKLIDQNNNNIRKSEELEKLLKLISDNTQNPGDLRVLKVTNLPDVIYDGEIIDRFGKYGDTKSIFMDHSSNRTLYITYMDYRDAEDAFLGTNNKEYRGGLIKSELIKAMF